MIRLSLSGKVSPIGLMKFLVSNKINESFFKVSLTIFWGEREFPKIRINTIKMKIFFQKVDDKSPKKCVPTRICTKLLISFGKTFNLL